MSPVLPRRYLNFDHRCCLCNEYFRGSFSRCLKKYLVIRTRWWKAAGMMSEKLCGIWLVRSRVMITRERRSIPVALTREAPCFATTVITGTTMAVITTQDATRWWLPVRPQRKSGAISAASNGWPRQRQRYSMRQFQPCHGPYQPYPWLSVVAPVITMTALLPNSRWW